MKRAIRVLISGGGTGGHIFPAISIANAIKARCPEADILFVGAENRMEMEKVPAAGYRIEGLPVSGFNRSNLLANFKVLWRLGKSLRLARQIVRGFNPDIAVGVGGYASGPTLWAAARRGVPTLIQEQNGFAGLTNRILGKKAGRICVAYEGMEKFFPAGKIVLTGNPIRKEIVPATPEMKAEAVRFYGLDPAKKHIFIVGGSLGSGTLNNSVKEWILQGCPYGENVELLWQCGKYYKPGIDGFMAEHKSDFIHHYDFIKRMDLAYAAADVVISRSGASSVSELCAAGKAVIFVPSPNVAEDHQTHNAMALVRKDAAMLIRDADAPQCLMREACRLVRDEEKIKEMEGNILKLARRDAAERIVEEIYELADLSTTLEMTKRVL